MDRTPEISVCLIAYKHEAFIAQAIEGALMQKMSVDFEIVVGEDFSPDNTRSIISEYAEKHPEIIRLIERDHNLGMHENWMQTIKACRGKYVAMLEGDDYWSDDQKLQLQYDLMERRPELSMCFHKQKVVHEGVKDDDPYVNQDIEERDYTTVDVIRKKWFIPTASVFFRRSALPDFPAWAKKLDFIDKTLMFLLSTNGPIGFVNQVMGVYRIHAGGISQVQWLGRENVFEASTIPFLKYADKYSGRKFHAAFNKRIVDSYIALLKKNKSDRKLRKKFFRGFISWKPFENRAEIKNYLINHRIPPSIYRFWAKLRGHKLDNAE